MPTKHVTTFEISRKHREMDPILMRYRDPNKEGHLQGREKTQLIQRLNDAKTRQLNYEQKFDIVTHVSHVKEPERVKYQPKMPDTRLTFNILNHQTLPGFPEPEKRSYDNEKVVPSQVRKEYNILNNKYWKDDEKKVAAERSKLKEDLDRKYWQTHDYHPIKGEYYDPTKEKDFVEMRSTAMKVHGEAKLRRLPPSIVHSEGATYDLINNRAKDQDRLRDAEEIANRAIRMKKGAQMEVMQKTRAVMEEDLELNRSLNKVRVERYTSEHKYNPVTNEEFQGRLGKQPPAPRPMMMATAFEKAQTGYGLADIEGTKPMMTDVFNRSTHPSHRFPSPLQSSGKRLASGGSSQRSNQLEAADKPFRSSSAGAEKGLGMGSSHRPSSYNSRLSEKSPQLSSGGSMGPGGLSVPKLNIPQIQSGSSSKRAVRTGGFATSSSFNS